MRQHLVPMLILATVAVSSSNILPMSVNDLNGEPLGLNRQHNDNIFSNRYKTRNVLEEIYKMYVDQENRPGLISKLQQKYAEADNNKNDDIFSTINKNKNYNGEGFRKEQWHNYPRQLDRLQQFYEHNSEKRNIDPNPNNARYTEEVAPDNQNMNDITNEFHVDRNTGTNNVYDAVIAANPLLLLKIRLACLNKDIDNANDHYANLITSGVETYNLREDEKNDGFRNENPEVNVMKVKREGATRAQNNELADNPTTQNKVVNKRIFSLWSRLQSLNHKGHELQHRRHLHAFYGLPDSDGGGTLTAETRATLMRPPGSPLRWG